MLVSFRGIQREFLLNDVRDLEHVIREKYATHNRIAVHGFSDKPSHA